jgi:hypothetical protein
MQNKEQLNFFVKNAINKISKGEEKFIKGGFEVDSVNRGRGFRLKTPFATPLNEMWIKTGWETEQEIQLTSQLNDDKYQDLGKVYNLPLFTDQENMFIAYPFIAGKELQSVRTPKNPQRIITTAALNSIISLSHQGLSFTDTNLVMGSNVLVTVNLDWKFIDLASLEISSKPYEIILKDYLKSLIEHVINRIIYKKPNDTIPTDIEMFKPIFWSLLKDEQVKMAFTDNQHNWTVNGFLSNEVLQQAVDNLIQVGDFSQFHYTLFYENVKAEADTY